MGDNGGNAVLRSIVDRIERLQAEKDGLASEISDIKREAKTQGFSLPALNELLRRRRMDKEKLDLLVANLEMYEAAIGDLKGTPLGNASAPK